MTATTTAKKYRFLRTDVLTLVIPGCVVGVK
jgi:hypothetical protein